MSLFSNLYSKIENYLLVDIKDNHSFLLFQKGLYVYLILYTLYLSPIANQLWGSNSLCPIIEVKRNWLFKV